MTRTKIPWNELPIFTVEDWIVLERQKAHRKKCRLRNRRNRAKARALLRNPGDQDKSHPWMGKPFIESQVAKIPIVEEKE